jgi:hypothetical protein
MGRKKEIEMPRGDGQTTRQMQASPQDAVFVWCNDILDYPRRLARKVGRTDLQIVGPNWLDDEKWRGLELTGLIIDHATIMGEKRRVARDEARWRVRPLTEQA